MKHESFVTLGAPYVQPLSTSGQILPKNGIVLYKFIRILMPEFQGDCM